MLGNLILSSKDSSTVGCLLWEGELMRKEVNNSSLTHPLKTWRRGGWWGWHWQLLLWDYQCRSTILKQLQIANLQNFSNCALVSEQGRDPIDWS